MIEDAFLNDMIKFMTTDPILDGLDSLMAEINEWIKDTKNEWIKDPKEDYIKMHSQEIERKASELNVSVDYYIAEFL